MKIRAFALQIFLGDGQGVRSVANQRCAPLPTVQTVAKIVMVRRKRSHGSPQARCLSSEEGAFRTPTSADPLTEKAEAPCRKKCYCTEDQSPRVATLDGTVAAKKKQSSIEIFQTLGAATRLPQAGPQNTKSAGHPPQVRLETEMPLRRPGCDAVRRAGGSGDHEGVQRLVRTQKPVCTQRKGTRR